MDRIKFKFFIRRFALFSFFKKMKQKRDLKKWVQKGSPIPPPDSVKQKTLLNRLKSENINVFIETGTYFGDTTDVFSAYASKVFTIEIKEEFWRNAVRRFRNKKNVKAILGDSGKVIKNILDMLDERALFWLDGHYNNIKESEIGQITPIYKELDEIYGHRVKNHLLMIDDARLFIGSNGYPELNKLKDYIKEKNSNASISIENDIIIVEN